MGVNKNMSESSNILALMVKDHCKIEELINKKKVISIDMLSRKLDISKTDARTIIEELILYNVVAGRIEKDKLILD